MRIIIPRLDYKYSFSDSILSLRGLLRKSYNFENLYTIFGHSNIFFMNHARTGLRMALNSLGLKENAKIGVVVYNCYTVFNSIRFAGFNCVFIDVTDKFQLDLKDLKSKKNVLDAIIVTHLFGIPSEIDKIKEILPNTPIIEDCAHSFMSTFKGELTGKFGDISIFSIGKGKFPSVGDGGYIVVNNNNIISNVKKQYKSLSNQTIYAEITNIFKSLLLSILHNSFIYGYFTLPFLKKIDNESDFSGKFIHHERKILKTNLSLFLTKLVNLDSKLKVRRNNGIENINMLEKDLNKILMPEIKCKGWNFFMVPLVLENDSINLIQLCYLKGYEIGKHFTDSIKWAVDFGYTNECPNAEIIANKIITISTYRKINHSN